MIEWSSYLLDLNYVAMDPVTATIRSTAHVKSSILIFFPIFYIFGTLNISVNDIKEIAFNYPHLSSFNITFKYIKSYTQYITTYQFFMQ